MLQGSVNYAMFAATWRQTRLGIQLHPDKSFISLEFFGLHLAKTVYFVGHVI
jgi:hypothetical protein